MNDLGVLLLGGAVRATALAALGVSLALVLRRRGPSAVALVALTTLSGLVAVTALSLSPWPRFWSVDLSAPARPVHVPPVPAPGGGPAPPPRVAAPGRGVDTRLADFARAFVAEFRVGAAPAPAAGGGWRWTAWAAAGLLGASALGFARLVLAVRAVARLRRDSRPIVDDRLIGEVGRLCDSAGCPRPVEARETDDLATPATVGWRRPVLLLPADWRDWDAAERRAVLAHELGHVRRGDYLSGLWAQACLAVHPYHPLAHWLVARLRLEQELAADGWGARLSGGNRPYLEALARLALRRPGPLESSPAAWPARPFLPTRGTLLRRIEMLRDSAPNPNRTDPLPAPARALTVAALAAAGLLVAGLRGPENAALARQNEDRPKAADAQAAPPGAAGGYDVFDLSHAPVNAMVVVAGRPAEVLGRPEFRPVADLLNAPGQKQNPWAGSLDLKPGDVEGVVMIVFRGRDGGGLPSPSMPPTVMFRASKPQDWKAVAGTFIKDPQVIEFQGHSYTRSKTPPTGAGYYTPDDRTIVIGTEGDLQQVIAARKGGPVRHAWDGAWSQVKKGQIAFALDPIWVRAQFPPAAPGTPQAALAGQAAMFGPLLDKTTGYAAGLDLGGGLGVDLVATCSSEEGAKSVAETLQAVITLGKNTLPGFRQQIGGQPPQAREASLRFLGLVDPLLANARVEVGQGGRSVRLNARTDGDVSALVQTLVPAVTAARSAARRAQDANNIKQLGLAMHNYNASNGHFPPAVIRPADGKPPYSWRVAILPYLEQNDLYKEYNFNEPWDGPSNRKLVERMPALYGYPGVETKAGNTAYFVVTGAGTLFPPGSPGVKLAEVTDGTSNTVMVVEAKREIPWTRPEDIPFDPAMPPPEFGGFQADGFMAGFADGSAHFLSSRINPVVLKALLTRAGGEILDSNALQGGPSAPGPGPKILRPLPPTPAPPALRR